MQYVYIEFDLALYIWIEGSKDRGAKITGSENNTVYSIPTVDVADDEDLRQAHNEEGPGGHVVVHQLQDVHATLW